MRFAPKTGIGWKLILFCLGALATAPAAHASCGAEGCSLDNGGFATGLRRFSIEASYQTVDQDRAQIGTGSARIGEIPGEEDEVRTLSQTVLLKGQVSLGPRWLATLTLPYLDRLHRHISHDHAPGAEPPLHEWRYSGIGDASLLGSWKAWGRGDASTPLTVSLQGGVKLPTGRRHVTPIDGDEPEPHARLGTGSYDALMGASVTHYHPVRTLSGSPGTMPIFVSTAVTLTGRGTEDYRVGSMLDASAGVTYPLADRLQFLTQVNLRARARDDAPAEDPAAHSNHVENTGGTAVYADPGLRFQAGPLISVSGYVQLPLYQKVNGIQLVAPYHLWLGATYRLP